WIISLKMESLVGFHELDNGLTLLGVVAAGDWEHEVYHFLYFDGQDIRGYVPREGNTWNKTTHKAYGNDEEADLADIVEQYGPGADESDVKFDVEAMKNEISQVFVAKDEGHGFLTEEQAKIVLEALDDICGDTVCEGDWQYYMVDVNCSAKTGVCKLQLDMKSSYGEDLWAKDVLDGMDEDALTRKGDAGSGPMGAGPYVAKALETVYRGEEEGVWVRFSFELDGNYKSFGDLIDGDGSDGGDDLKENFWYHFLDCESGAEQILNSLPEAKDKNDNFLTEDQAKTVTDAFDSVCGDTFCGGDFNYYMVGASCSSSTGICELTVDAQPYEEDDRWEEDVLDGVDEDELTRKGDGHGPEDFGSGPYVARILETVSRDKQPGVWLRMSCKLDGNYQNFSQLIEGDGSHGGDDLVEGFYYHFLDCLHSMDPVLAGLCGYTYPTN
ncbi:MAG: hypothetical protein V1754_12690, partial [Pseudomonadota bacterium]